MKKKANGLDKIKENRFPLSLFGVYSGVLFLMSGIHTGLVMLMATLNLSGIVQTILPIIYWGIIAIGLTLFTRKKMKETYEEPMHKLADATKKVSEGDFSVFIPTINTSEKLDYLDIMILDFNKMVEELGSIETLKTDFISNVSHEIRTPLSIIRNYGEMMQMEHIDDAQRIECAKVIEETVDKMSVLISNILKLNKLENQIINPEKVKYDICRQLCESLLMFEEILENKEIETEIEIEDRAYIHADENLMEIVWNNLISNALKFSVQGGLLKVVQSSDEQYVRISITDTGCGMSEETKNHIFEKFYQGDQSHSGEGNGLGLALVRRVIDLMDGEIHVTSQKGRGSTFTVLLPTAERKISIGE